MSRQDARSGADRPRDRRGAAGRARRADPRAARAARLLPGHGTCRRRRRRHRRARRRSRHDRDRDHDDRSVRRRGRQAGATSRRTSRCRSSAPPTFGSAFRSSSSTRSGKVVATNPITFVAPRVDEATQTVLVKSLLKDVPPSMRVQQYIRVQAGLADVAGPDGARCRRHRASAVSTSRSSPSPRATGFVARQRPSRSASIVGDDYVVLAGSNQASG